MFERASGIGTVCTAEPTACDGTYSGASLDLYNKSLTGTIPPELAQLSNTLTDALCAARPPGAPPRSRHAACPIAPSALLSCRDLRHNSLSGTVPTGIFQLTQLSNWMCPPPPDTRQICHLQTYIYHPHCPLSCRELSHNSLSGTIPTQVGLLSEISYALCARCLASTLCHSAPPHP
jgi:hypothetical protein